MVDWMLMDIFWIILLTYGWTVTALFLLEVAINTISNIAYNKELLFH